MNTSIQPTSVTCRFRPLPFLVYGGIISALLFAFFSHWAYDDPFITFRYAKNLRTGLGFVYNPGERVLSTTTPLYTLLLAVCSFLWSDLPRLSNLIGAVSLTSGSIALYVLGCRWNLPLAGFFAAILLPLFPLMVSTFGAETCLYVMLTLWAFVLHAKGQHMGAMGLAALATLTRADGVLVGIVLGIDLLIKQRRIPWRPIALFGVLIAPWYLFSWAYFGSPFPVTLAAKQHQAEMAISEHFAQGFVRLLRGYGRYPLYWLQGGLAFIGLGHAASRSRRWMLLPVWGILYFFSYSLLGVSRYFWYYAPLVPPFLVLVGLGTETLVRWAGMNVRRGWLPRCGIGLLLLLLCLPQLSGLRYLYTHPDSRAGIYREVGEWLAKNTPPEASIGALEVGIIGYYADRRMIDFAGLIQPDVGQQMRYETTYEDTAIWAVHQYHPNYLVLNPGWFPRLMEEVVKQACTPLKEFTRADYPGILVVYTCDTSEPSLTSEPIRK